MIALAIAAILSLPILVMLLTRPVLRRLALRNAARRPREALLVIAGSMLGTALMTAAFVVGNTFNASVRANAYTQLGPIDEVATVPLTNAASLAPLTRIHNAAIDGTLGVTTTDASTARLDRAGRIAAAAPKTQLLELDFAAAHRFGGDFGATGISGPEPLPGTAVLVDRLAVKLGVHAGDTFDAYAFGRSVRLRVDRVIPQTGVAGYWPGSEVVSYNAFVAPGTIASLATHTAQANAPPQYSVFVSNRGGVESGAALTATVTAALQRAVPSVPLRVEPVKQALLDDATATGNMFSSIYRTLGTFAVAAGVLLLVNIFLMLADERKSELGMLRAMGLRRRSLMGAFAIEGWFYAIIACTVGMLLGLGVGRLVMVGASRLTNGSNADFRLPIRFHYTAYSLESGFTLGLVIAMVTILGTSIAISRLNIIAAIRDLDRPKPPRELHVTLGFGLICAIGGGLLAIGVVTLSATWMMLGGVLAVIGLRRVLHALPDRLAVTICAGGLLGWCVAAVPLTAVLGGDLPISTFIVQGLTLVIASVVLVTEYQGEIGHWLAHVSSRNLSVRLGLAYPLARRQRTALTLAQFSIVVFVLVYISVLSSMFSAQVGSLSRKLSGGYNVVLSSDRANPVDLAAVARDPGVRSVAPLNSAEGDFTSKGSTGAVQSLMTGFDSRFLASGAPQLEDRGHFPNDRAVYDYVLSHPGSAIVDDSFASGKRGPTQTSVSIGSKVTMTDPTTGRSMQLVIVARTQPDWADNGGFTSAVTMRDVFGAGAVTNRAYIDAVDPASFVTTVEARYFAQGAIADTLHSLVQQGLARQDQFLELMRSFLALGLVVGVAGIGVIMVRAVRERKRQVGVLRSLGFPAIGVSNAFAIEAMFVALEGVLIGVVLGLVCTWSVSLADSFGTDLPFTVPWAALGLLVAATLVGSLLATWSPARAASKIKPAVALRAAD
ncbi:MAG TPA: FtsX-like permease family protein [Acidimicrobiia bacterium]